ncbi:hypothetical protein PRNP1_000177 [Phytophthora ramorum]
MLDVAMMHERTRAKSEEFAVGGGDKPGVMPDASSEDAESQPVFQSRLRAKKEERMLQRQLEQELSRSPGAAALLGSEINTKVAVRGGHESISPGKDIGSSVHGNSHGPIAAEAGEDAIKRRERAEARKRVIEYRGTVWDAVSNNELEMVQNYFLVEGAQMLLRRRHPDAEQGGRSLLHCAAWLGYKAIVELILTTGCDVDVVDSVASMTTALSEAARAGHADVCVSLLRHGANPRRCDSHGDTPFHWAGRQGHGTVLLQMALEQERLQSGSTPTLWVMKEEAMEGIILTVSSEGQHRHHLQQKKKHEWRNLFLKLDDISARLIAFTDRSQFEVRWSVQLVGADISTPVPGEPSHGIDVNDTPYCFYVRETSVVKDCTHYFSAPDGSSKKAWMKALTQIARDGPRVPRFAVSQAENEFEFHARVVKFRPHVDGTHAEYMITCSCQVFSKLVARRLMKEWSLWRRFSEFDELHIALKKTLGPQMEGIDLIKHKRDAFRGVLGKAFDHGFLEDRRVLLDSFVSNVCNVRTAVDFFKHHYDPHLKAFFEFDEYCEDVDQSLHKAKGSRSKSKGSASRQNDDGDIRRASTVSRASDIEDRKSSHSRTSAASNASSEGGRSRSKTTRHSEADKRTDSTSSQASMSSRASTSSRVSDSRVSGDEGSSHHHRRHHRKKSGDADKKDRRKSDKREPAASYGSAEAEVRPANTTS